MANSAPTVGPAEFIAVVESLAPFTVDAPLAAPLGDVAGGEYAIGWAHADLDLAEVTTVEVAALEIADDNAFSIGAVARILRYDLDGIAVCVGGYTGTALYAAPSVAPLQDRAFYDRVVERARAVAGPVDRTSAYARSLVVVRTALQYNRVHPEAIPAILKP